MEAFRLCIREEKNFQTTRKKTEDPEGNANYDLVLDMVGSLLSK